MTTNSISPVASSSGLHDALAEGAKPLEFALVVPTLNERDNVAVLVRAVRAALPDRAYEIIFVDDWSSDGTPDAVASLAIEHPVRLIRRYGRRGLSSAVIEGALATFAPIIVVIDADMQHDERIVPALVAAVEGGADVAIGSRYCEQGSVGDWAGSRASGSRLATWLSQALLKTDVTDPMSGFFAVRRDVLLAALPNLSSMGFKILLDLLASSPRALRVTEEPYEFRLRHAGASKLDATVAIDFILLLLDKRIGKWISPRLIMFFGVGGLGMAVHWTMLKLGLALIGNSLPPADAFKPANILGVVSAITFNFLLNNNLTYHDKKLRGWAAVRGLAIFYAVCGIGAVANVGAGNYVFGRDHNTLVAVIAGSVVGSVWNFAVSSVTTWQKR